MAGDGIGEGGSKCIPDSKIANDPYEDWTKNLIVYAQNNAVWDRVTEYVPTAYVDLACAFSSSTPPGGFEKIETQQQLLGMEAFLLRFGFLKCITIGMITDKLITLDPSLAMTQILTVLFLIGTIDHGFQMLNLLRIWVRLRNYCDSKTNPCSLNTLSLDFAGIGYMRSRLREFTFTSSIKVLASWYTTSYVFHITNMGIRLIPVDSTKDLLPGLGGMLTSIWTAMEINSIQRPITKALATWSSSWSLGPCTSSV